MNKLGIMRLLIWSGIISFGIGFWWTIIDFII